MCYVHPLVLNDPHFVFFLIWFYFFQNKKILFLHPTRGKQSFLKVESNQLFSKNTLQKMIKKMERSNSFYNFKLLFSNVHVWDCVLCQHLFSYHFQISFLLDYILFLRPFTERKFLSLLSSQKKISVAIVCFPWCIISTGRTSTWVGLVIIKGHKSHQLISGVQAEMDSNTVSVAFVKIHHI